VKLSVYCQQVVGLTMTSTLPSLQPRVKYIPSNTNISLFRLRGQGKRRSYRHLLRAGRSANRIPVGGDILHTVVQTSPGTHPASCTMGTGFLSRR
jgi:hypothetical protein